MDKADLLAAGRKKLQQYRQKKGSSSKGSSSSKGKPNPKSAKSEFTVNAASGSSKVSGLPEVLDNEAINIPRDESICSTEKNNDANDEIAIISSSNVGTEEFREILSENLAMEANEAPEDTVVVHDETEVSASYDIPDHAYSAIDGVKVTTQQPNQLIDQEKVFRGTEVNDMDLSKTRGINEVEVHDDESSDIKEGKTDKAENLEANRTVANPDYALADAPVISSATSTGIIEKSREDDENIVAGYSLMAEPFHQQFVAEDSFVLIEKNQEDALSQEYVKPATLELGLELSCREEHSKLYNSDMWDSLNEELLLANLEKDLIFRLFSLQSYALKERDLQLHMIDNDLIELRGVLEESQRKESNLMDDLIHSKSALQFLENEKECLLKKLSETEEKMAGHHMVLNSLERTVFDNSSLSQKLAEFEKSIAALESENTGLNERLLSAAEEKVILSEEKNSLLHYNALHLNEATRFKTLVATLQDQCSEFSELVVSMEVEKQALANELETVSTERTKLNSLTEILHVEVASSKDHLLYASEERTKLIEENNNLQHEKTYLSSEVTRLTNSITALQKECSEFSELASSATGENEKNEVEKQSLASELEKVYSERTNLDNQIKNLHVEISSLRESFNLSKVEIGNLEKHVEILTEENSKLTSELVTEGVRFIGCKDKNDEMCNDIKIMKKHIEQLTEDNSGLTREHEIRMLADNRLHEVQGELDVLLKVVENLSASNTELLILNEAYKNYAFHLKECNDDLVGLHNTLHMKHGDVMEKIDSHQKMQSQFESTILELQEHLHEVKSDSDVLITALKVQLENVWHESAAKFSMVEHAQSVAANYIISAVQKLHEMVGDHPEICDDTELHVKLQMYVDAVSHIIVNLTEENNIVRVNEEMSIKYLEEAKGKNEELLNKNGLSYKTMCEFLSELRLILSNSVGSVKVNSIDDSGELNVELLRKKLSVGNFSLLSLSRELRVEYIEKLIDVDHLDRFILQAVLFIEDSLKQKMDESDLPIYFSCLLALLLVYCYENVKAELNTCKSNNSGGIKDFQELDGREVSLKSVEESENDEASYLRRQLTNVEEALQASESKLHQKEDELMSCEQKVSSIREKLGIAVAKGKGLVGQRDALKQSLAETSGELERCSLDIQMKNSRIQELEDTLKTYVEAGERVEALESELSYIRNSATSLRESFLLKDSVLLRVEEMLEALDLSEDFHSRDIIEKVELLVSLAKGQSLFDGAGELTNSVRSSFPDENQGTMDIWSREPRDMNSFDDLKRNFDGLESKFYQLAEQNEMLEQSLMERNIVVQRWETTLDKFDLPAPIRALEPEERMEWINDALSQAYDEQSHLMHKNNYLERHCASMKTDIDDLQQTRSFLTEQLEDYQKRNLLQTRNFEVFVSTLETLSSIVVHRSIEVNMLRDEDLLLDQELNKKNDLENILNLLKSRIQALNEFVLNFLHKVELNAEMDVTSFDCLEMLVKKLVNDHPTDYSASVMNIDHRDTDMDTSENKRSDLISEIVSVDHLKQEIKEISFELKNVVEERDKYIVLQNNLTREVEELKKRQLELQEQISLEEQKSGSARVKLNVAVRKGKSLVQQRDGLKQEIEELSDKVIRLEMEVRQRDKNQSEYESMIETLTRQAEKVAPLETEISLLKTHSLETQDAIRAKESFFTIILDTLRDLDVGREVPISDPKEKLEHLGKLCRELSDESRKSKRSSELLLAELNEVQEQNDILQEDLMNANASLKYLSEERAIALASKDEALSKLDVLSRSHNDERTKFVSDLETVKAAMLQLRQEISDTNDQLARFFSVDLEFLQKLERGFESGLTGLQVDVPYRNENKRSHTETVFSHLNMLDSSSIIVKDSVMDFARDIASLKPFVHKHLDSWKYHAEKLLESFDAFRRDVNSKKSSFKEEQQNVMIAFAEKEKEVTILRKNVSILYEACVNSIIELENRKTEKKQDINYSSFPSEDLIMFTAERLAKNLSSLRDELDGHDLNEMKSTITNLRKEIQVKDSERERIYMQLVNQIKVAEESAASSNTSALRELQNEKLLREQLQEKLRSKDQEIEALMQALEEEEVQMEGLKIKINELENSIAQKVSDFENSEASRAKLSKKLSATVAKFDELHQLSGNFLTEVENLQSQVKDRDDEISFLRQEVTRCAQDAINASQMTDQKVSDELYDLLTWLETLFPQDAIQIEEPNESLTGKDLIRQRIGSVISLLQNKETLLQNETVKVDELSRKQELLQKALNEKESQISALQREDGEIQSQTLTSTWKSSAPTPSQVRSLRKSNNDQVAIDIDMDEDDDKVHGFKSLTSSRIVPKFTRPVTDMIDGLWVSCDRALMRKPAFRVGIMMYWALLHAILAAFVF